MTVFIMNLDKYFCDSQNVRNAYLSVRKQIIAAIFLLGVTNAR